MLERIRNSTFSSINSVAEPLIVKALIELLKPASAIASPEIVDTFEKMMGKEVETIPITSGDRTLIAHKLSLKHPSATRKKAIIYVGGNGEYVASSMLCMLPLIKDMISESNHIRSNVNYAFYCQDYRGRGYNKSRSDEHFNQYPLAQDAKDQAALVAKLLDEGYAPTDILMIGHSLGSAVALWACNKLIKTHKECENIKIYCDRGYGNLLNHPIIKPFLSDEKQTQEKLQAVGLMPLVSLHDTCLNLKNTLVVRADRDSIIGEAVSLATTFKPSENHGKVWVTEAITDDEKVHLDPHNAAFSEQRMQGISQLKPHHLMLAMLHQIPIQLITQFKLPDIKGYSLRNNSRSGDNSFIAIPRKFNVSDEGELPANDNKKNFQASIRIYSPSTLIAMLHQYCASRSHEARESGSGERYKRGLMGKFGAGWTVKQQIETAVKIMNALADERGPNLEMFDKLEKEEGPHKSGDLKEYYIKAQQFAADWNRVEAFNQWIKSMPCEQVIKKEVKQESVSKIGLFRRAALVAGGVGGAILTGGVGGALILGGVGYFSPDIAKTAIDKISECCGSRKIKKI